jgi:hypothetical protein
VDVQALRLVDEGAAVGSQIEHAALLDLPHGLVQLTEVLGDFGDVLDRASVREDLVLDVHVLEVELDEVLDKVLVDHHEVVRPDGEVSSKIKTRQNKRTAPGASRCWT